MTDRPYSVATLAERWGCSRRHVANLIRNGALQSFRVGNLLRVRPEVVEQYECGTGLPSIKGDTSRSSMREAVEGELRLRRLTSSKPQQRRQSLSVISNNESPGKD